MRKSVYEQDREENSKKNNQTVSFSHTSGDTD